MTAFDGPGGEGTMLFRGLRIRIAGTVLLLVGGAVFILLYLAFVATGFTWYQNLAVVLTTVLVVPSAVALLWVFWGMGLKRRWFEHRHGPSP